LTYLLEGKNGFGCGGGVAGEPVVDATVQGAAGALIQEFMGSGHPDRGASGAGLEEQP
jgi:hypothetical protein